MALNRAWTEEEAFGNFRISQALAKERKDLALSRRQAMRAGGDDAGRLCPERQGRGGIEMNREGVGNCLLH